MNAKNKNSLSLFAPCLPLPLWWLTRSLLRLQRSAVVRRRLRLLTDSCTGQQRQRGSHSCHKQSLCPFTKLRATLSDHWHRLTWNWHAAFPESKRQKQSFHREDCSKHSEQKHFAAEWLHFFFLPPPGYLIGGQPL
mgnify:CR=1 FL=1